MRRGQWILASLLAAASLSSISEWTSAADPPDKSAADHVELGRKLFLHDWSKPESWDSGIELGDGGDGLGPMYNAVSCVACHHLGGIGGAGPIEANVDLLHVMRPRGRALSLRRSAFMKDAARIHPGFEDGLSVVLHGFGIDETDNPYPYHAWRSRLLGLSEKQPLSPEHPSRRIDGINVRFTQRNTPALFGAGIIDSIPEKVLIETAGRQRFEGVSGRVAKTDTGKVGRFGWRGQTATLHDFVLGACANELGLTVPGSVQPENTLARLERSKSNRIDRLLAPSRAEQLDLTDEQCRALTAFVARLSPEPAARPKDRHAVADAEGEELFATIGCTACHLADLGPARGIYSDLLLHDMGPGLSDPLAAAPDLPIDSPRIQRPESSGGYSGSSLAMRTRQTESLEQEWRTPPLWGVSLSAPYLHDGRAATLEEAVLLHGGEASEAITRFRRLSENEQKLVLRFLASIPAPAASHVSAPAAAAQPGGDAKAASATRRQINTEPCPPSPPSVRTRRAPADGRLAAASSPGRAAPSPAPRR